MEGFRYEIGRGAKREILRELIIDRLMEYSPDYVEDCLYEELVDFGDELQAVRTGYYVFLFHKTPDVTSSEYGQFELFGFKVESIPNSTNLNELLDILTNKIYISSNGENDNYMNEDVLITAYSNGFSADKGTALCIDLIDGAVDINYGSIQSYYNYDGLEYMNVYYTYSDARNELMTLFNTFDSSNTGSTGRSRLVLGNNIKSKNAGNQRGELVIFGDGDRFVKLLKDDTTLTKDVLVRLPSSDGTLALTSQVSDRNKKKNINPLNEKYIKFFSLLLPVSYQYKDEIDGKTHIGFIAQDVEEAMLTAGLTSFDFFGFQKIRRKNYKRIEGEDGVVTEVESFAVDEDGNPIYDYSLAYNEFIGLIAKVLQISIDRIDLIEKTVEELEGKFTH